MKKLLIIPLVAIVGCASYSSTQAVTEKDGSTRTTRVRIHTLFDANNSISKVKTTNTDKTQSTGVDGLGQQSSGSNVVAVLEKIDSIVGKVAK
jgi:hypothetical protein